MTALDQWIAVNVGEAVRARRIELGFTQDQIARATGFQRTVVARIEQGHHSPELDTVKILARVLRCRTVDLLSCLNRIPSRLFGSLADRQDTRLR